jgi:hypothetical protein
MQILKTLAALLLLAGMAFAQGSIITGPPVAVDPLGHPLANVTVAICSALPVTTPCSSLVATYTDITLGHLCTGVAGSQPLNNELNPTVGSGCSNPGLADNGGNIIAFGGPGALYCQYYGPNIVTTYQRCQFPGWTGNFVDLISNQTVNGNKTFGGLTVFTNTVTMSGARFTPDPTAGLLLRGSGELLNNTVSGHLLHSYAGNSTYELAAGVGTGTTSTGGMLAVVSNGNVGEFQFQAQEAGAFGWRNCNTGAGTCIVWINAQGDDQLLSIGGSTTANTAIDHNVILEKCPGDCAFRLFANNGAGITSSFEIDSVVSSGTIGEVQFRLKDINANYFRFVNTVLGRTVAQFSAIAPTNSLKINDSGSIQAGSGGLAFASLPADGNGSMIYCTNCKNVVDDGATAGVACVAGGAGALARRQNGRWDCN